MRYIAYWELDQHNMDAAVDKVNQITTMMDQTLKNSTKVLFPHTLMEIGYSGFTIIETEDPSILGSMLVMASPEVKINFVPLYDAQKALKDYQSTRQMMRTSTGTTTRATTSPRTREEYERSLNV